MKKTPLLAIPLAASALFGWGCAKPAEPINQNPSTPAATTQTPPSNEAKAPTPTDAKATQPTTTKPTTTTTKTPIKPTTKPTTTKPSAAYQTVTITSSQFSPQVVGIFEGDGITWVNKDSAPHTTHSDGSLLWDSGSIAPGSSYRHVFPSTGTYAYSDGNNGKLHGTIVVSARPK